MSSRIRTAVLPTTVALIVAAYATGCGTDGDSDTSALVLPPNTAVGVTTTVTGGTTTVISGTTSVISGTTTVTGGTTTVISGTTTVVNGTTTVTGGTTTVTGGTTTVTGGTTTVTGGTTTVVSGTTTTTTVTTPPTAEPTGTIRVQTVQARTLASNVTSIRLTGFDSTRHAIYGPETQARTGSVDFAGVPTRVTSVSIEFLAGTTLTGIGQQSVTLNEGQVTLISDPNYASVSDLSSIQVTPATANVAAGFNQSFRATGSFSNGQTLDLSSAVTWSSSNTNNVTVNSLGEARGVVPNTSATLTATLDNRSGQATLNVTAATLVSIAVQPVSPTLVVGSTLAFTAQGTFSDNSTAPLSSVTWSSSAPNLAPIDPTTGVARGRFAGRSTVTATLGSLSGGTVLSVITSTPPDLQITTDSLFNTDTGTLDTDLTDASGGSVAAGWTGSQLQLNSLALGAGVTLRVVGSRPFDLQVSGDVNLRGTLAAAGQNGEASITGRVTQGGAGGPGGFAGANGSALSNSSAGQAGFGPGAGGGAPNPGTTATPNPASGGGGAGHISVGRAGFQGTSFSGAPYASGAAGVVYAGFTGGSGGGSGTANFPLSSRSSGSGGGGGGAVRIACGGSLHLFSTCTIDCQGGAGGNSASYSGPGGGGSGGSIVLLSSPTATVDVGAQLLLGGGFGGTPNTAPNNSGNGGGGQLTVSELP